MGGVPDKVPLAGTSTKLNVKASPSTSLPASVTTTAESSAVAKLMAAPPITTGASFTLVTVMLTVAGRLGPVPSLATKENVSTPE